MDIYVGNLAYEATDEDLHEAFSPHGRVTSARIIKDRETGRSRGFGFVEMDDPSEAQVAIDNVNGRDIKGRTVTVNQARAREEGFGGGGGGARQDGPRW